MAWRLKVSEISYLRPVFERFMSPCPINSFTRIKRAVIILFSLWPVASSKVPFSCSLRRFLSYSWRKFSAGSEPGDDSLSMNCNSSLFGAWVSVWHASKMAYKNFLTLYRVWFSLSSLIFESDTSIKLRIGSLMTPSSCFSAILTIHDLALSRPAMY